jgi:hypothetical protein
VAKGLTAKLLGERKVLAVFKRLTKTAQREMQDATVDALQEIRTLTVRDTPVDHGRLRSSYRVDMRLDKLGGRVGTNVVYAPYVEHGTRPHVIRPKNAKALRFSLQTGSKLSNRQAIFSTIYAKSVNHPGTSAQPHLGPAYRKVTPEYLRKIPRSMRTAIRRAKR